jgi:hypothetical protein
MIANSSTTAIFTLIINNEVDLGGGIFVQFPSNWID